MGHTGIARLCLAQKCYRTRTKLAEVGKPHLQVGEDVTIAIFSINSKIEITYSLSLKNISSDFSSTTKAQLSVNKRNYICGLGARFEYERVEASIQTAATKVTNIVSFIY